MNTTENKQLATEQIKAIELRNYKIWEDTKWKMHKWQLCKLGGYCYNANGYEEPNSKKLKRLWGGKKWNGVVIYNSMSALLHNDEIVYSIFFTRCWNG